MELVKLTVEHTNELGKIWNFDRAALSVLSNCLGHQSLSTIMSGNMMQRETVRATIRDVSTGLKYRTAKLVRKNEQHAAINYMFEHFAQPIR